MKTLPLKTDLSRKTQQIKVLSHSLGVMVFSLLERWVKKNGIYSLISKLSDACLHPCLLPSLPLNLHCPSLSPDQPLKLCFICPAFSSSYSHPKFCLVVLLVQIFILIFSPLLSPFFSVNGTAEARPKSSVF